MAGVSRRNIVVGIPVLASLGVLPGRHAIARRRGHQASTTLRVLIPVGSEANVGPIASSFEAATGIHVELKTSPVDEIATHMQLRTLGGDSGFDVALPPTFAIPDLAKAGTIMPLEEIAGFDATVQGDAERSLYSLGDRYDGKTYGFQTDGDVYLMFYRGDWIQSDAERTAYEDRFGSPLEIPKTWQQLDRTMEFFHRPDDGRYGGTLFRTPSYIAWEFWIRLHAKGVYPLSEQFQSRLDSDEGRAAAEELVAASKWQSPGSSTNGLFENWDDYGSGNAFCNIGWGGSQKAFRRRGASFTDQLVFAPTPGGEFDGEAVPVSYFNWGWNYTVSAHARVPQDALRFARYATMGDASTEGVRAEGGYFDPYLDSHYADAEIERVYSAAFLKTHRASLLEAIPDLYVAGRGEYFDLLARFLDRANRGVMEVPAALEVISRGWDLLTDKIGRDGQIAQWERLRAAYPESLRSRLRLS